MSVVLSASPVCSISCRTTDSSSCRSVVFIVVLSCTRSVTATAVVVVVVAVVVVMARYAQDMTCIVWREAGQAAVVLYQTRAQPEAPVLRDTDGHCQLAWAPRSVDALDLRRVLQAVVVDRVVGVLVDMLVVTVAVVVVVAVAVVVVVAIHSQDA